MQLLILKTAVGGVVFSWSSFQLGDIASLILFEQKVFIFDLSSRRLDIFCFLMTHIETTFSEFC